MIAIIIFTGGIGVVAGIVASGIMELYQGPAGKLFKLPDSDEEPSTVMAANAVAVLVTGKKIAEPNRDAAGRAIHYVTGAMLGLAYGIATAFWPAASIGLGLGFGIVVWIGLDLIAVPAMGWGTKPWKAATNTLAYALSAHLVFGVATEVVRRGVVALL